MLSRILIGVDESDSYAHILLRFAEVPFNIKIFDELTTCAKTSIFFE